MAVFNLDARPDLKDFHLRWAGLKPPLRPHDNVVAAMRRLCAGGAGRALQLGVTPEIAHLPAASLAIDWSAAMLRDAWPGDTATHKAVVGDWLAMPVADASTELVFGDGCLSVLGWPDDNIRLLDEVRRVLRPGGRLVLRCFAGPNMPGSMAALVAAVFAGGFASFGAFKLRFNMQAFHLADGRANSGMFIHELFEQNFPDRAALAAATGWSVDEIGGIDAYRGSLAVHNYPARRQIAGLLGAARAYFFVETEGYKLAEFCPLLVVKF